MENRKKRWDDYKRGRGKYLSKKDLGEMYDELLTAKKLLVAIGGYDLAIYKLSIEIDNFERVMSSVEETNDE